MLQILNEINRVIEAFRIVSFAFFDTVANGEYVMAIEKFNEKFQVGDHVLWCPVDVNTDRKLELEKVCTAGEAFTDEHGVDVVEIEYSYAGRIFIPIEHVRELEKSEQHGLQLKSDLTEGVELDRKYMARYGDSAEEVAEANQGNGRTRKS